MTQIFTVDENIVYISAPMLTKRYGQFIYRVDLKHKIVDTYELR